MNNNGIDTTQTTGMQGVTPATSAGNTTAPVPPFQPQPDQMGTQTPVSSPSFNAPSIDTSTPPSTPSWTPPVNTPSPIPGSAGFSSTPPTTPSWTAPSAPSMAPPPPTTPQTPSSDFKPEHEGKSKLPLVIAGILLILAMGGAYFLYMLYQTPPPTVENAPVAEQTVSPTAVPSPTMTEDEKAQAEINEMENVSTSDEVEALEEDLNKTNLTNIDSGLTPSPAQ